MSIMKTKFYFSTLKLWPGTLDFTTLNGILPIISWQTRILCFENIYSKNCIINNYNIKLQNGNQKQNSENKHGNDMIDFKHFVS